MIDVGIIGCDNLRGCELVRILINHPDVELKWVTSSTGTGKRLDRLVPGIVGECDLVASPVGPLGEVDVAFVCVPRQLVAESLNAISLPEGTRVVDLSGSHNLDHAPGSLWTYGLSEMQRRVLVHDTSLVTVPGNAAAASLIALMPMARNLLLNSPVSLQVAMGEAAFVPGSDLPRRMADGMTIEQWADEQRQEVLLALGQCQSSFSQPVEMTITPLDERRILTVEARFKCGVDGDMVRQLYEQYYEDHNFVFMVDRPILAADVENTAKCLIRLDRDEHSGVLTVHAVMDALLKGSAGMAVHVMNLMFGLHERVGLALKGTGC